MSEEQIRYVVIDKEHKKIHLMTVDEILSEINRDHSEDWIDYDESDWREGMEQWTQLVLLAELNETKKPERDDIKRLST